MRRLIMMGRKYRTLITAEWGVTVAYRAETLIWFIGSFIQPLVSLMIWLSIEQQSGDGGIAGYGAAQFILYFIGVMVVGRMTSSWDIWSLDQHIRQGTFSHHLLRPLHPIHTYFAANIATKLFWAVLVIPVWLLLALVLPALRLPTTPLLLMLAVASIVLAMCVRFLIGFQIGILAFWSNKAVSLYMLYDLIHLFLSGRIAPLTMFPDWVKVIAEWLPFYITIGFPVELLTGQLQAPAAIVKGFALQAFWLCALGLLFTWQWKQGLKKYGAVGG